MSIVILGPAKDEGDTISIGAEIVKLVAYSPTTIAFDWLQADGSYKRAEIENPHLTYLKEKVKAQPEAEQ